jgi:Protein of unknown function (DUF2934)
MQSVRKNNVAPPAPTRVTSLAPTALSPVTAIERKEPAAQIAQTVRPSHEDIAKAAYLRWLKEGGDAETNWLEAERSMARTAPKG